MLEILKVAEDYLRLSYRNRITVASELGLLDSRIIRIMDVEEMDQEIFKKAVDKNKLQELALAVSHWEWIDDH